MSLVYLYILTGLFYFKGTVVRDFYLGYFASIMFNMHKSGCYAYQPLLNRLRLWILCIPTSTQQTEALDTMHTEILLNMPRPWILCISPLTQHAQNLDTMYINLLLNMPGI